MQQFFSIDDDEIRLIVVVGGQIWHHMGTLHAYGVQCSACNVIYILNRLINVHQQAQL